MGTPAIVMGDKVTGTCAIHQVPNPASGAPQPSPAPLPFSAPLLQGLATKVLIGGKPAAVMGSSGYNTPPHVGLHATDPFMTPTLQEGRVISGSTTVLFEGKPAATLSSSVTCCATPGTLVPTVSDVIVG
jgi:uncharacterized Zn-binding protein involved in type VI secretion